MTKMLTITVTKALQIKTMRRYHSMPTRMVKIKKYRLSESGTAGLLGYTVSRKIK